jgi:hypothetical protein
LCDQDGHHISTCAIKKAITAGKEVGMVDGSMQVLVANAHEYTDDPDQGMQTFNISCFSVTAVHEPETPPVTANWQPRGHPYDALNETTTVEVQEQGTVEIGQPRGQAISYATANEDQCQLCSAQAEAAVDARAQSTLRKLQRDNAGLQAQLVESREREAALVQMLQGHSTELQRVTTFTGGAESTDACGVKAVTSLGVPGEPAETAGVLGELVEKAGILGGLDKNLKTPERT